MPSICKRKIILSTVLTFSLLGWNAKAQFEEDEDFGAPSTGASAGAPGLRQKSKTGSDDKVMSTTKKEKLAHSGVEDITNENFPEIIESFDFPNANISDIVKAISELTGKNFIIEPGISQKITIIAPSKITVAEAYKAFLSALAINNLAVVPGDGFYKIRSNRNAKKEGIETYSNTYFPNSDQLITKVIHLKHVSSDNVSKMLGNLVSGGQSDIQTYQDTNSIIISDYGSNIERIMKIINSIDTPGFEEQLEVVPVKFAKSKDIADLVGKITNKGNNQNNNGMPFSSGIPRGGRVGGSQGAANFTVIPDDRTNSIIIVGNKAGIARVKKLLAQLDFKLNPEDQSGVNVYYVKYGDAEKIATTLSGVTKDAGPKPQSQSNPFGGIPNINPISGIQTVNQEVFGADVKITADKGTNSLVIVASRQDYETISNILSKIDIPRDQVYIETVIMEMRNQDNFDWKTGFLQFSETGAKAGFNFFKQDELTGFLTPGAAPQGVLIPAASASTVTVKDSKGNPTTLPGYLGFINFLKTNGNLNILSTPQIMALDNTEATIEVGDKIATSKSSNVTANGVTSNSYTFEEATIKFVIKPIINPTSKAIRLEINGSIKQPSSKQAPGALANEVQQLATRSIKTSIVVPTGDTAVIGGLMKEDEEEVISKVPLLGDIPILGWLFKSRRTAKDKTNLMVFLTPKIIRTPEDNESLLARKVEQRKEYVKKTGGEDPFGSTMDDLTKKTPAKTESPDWDLEKQTE